MVWHYILRFAPILRQGIVDILTAIQAGVTKPAVFFKNSFKKSTT